jgi:CRISPR-associated protein Csd2
VTNFARHYVTPRLTFARSINPIAPLDLSITRVALENPGEKPRETEDERASTGTMGRKALVPYALYRGHGFFTPHFAKQTGVRREDLVLFWDALQQMWDLDRSASRGMMTLRGLYVFSHATAVGSAPAHELFDRIVVCRRTGVETARRFSDYEVLVNQAERGDGALVDLPLPEGITLTRLVG